MRGGGEFGGKFGAIVGEGVEQGGEEGGIGFVEGVLGEPEAEGGASGDPAAEKMGEVVGDGAVRVEETDGTVEDGDEVLEAEGEGGEVAEFARFDGGGGVLDDGEEGAQACVLGGVMVVFGGFEGVGDGAGFGVVDATETPGAGGDAGDEVFLDGSNGGEVAVEIREEGGEVVLGLGMGAEGEDDSGGVEPGGEGVAGGDDLAGGSARTSGELGVAAVGGELFIGDGHGKGLLGSGG